MKKTKKAVQSKTTKKSGINWDDVVDAINKLPPDSLVYFCANVGKEADLVFELQNCNTQVSMGVGGYKGNLELSFRLTKLNIMPLMHKETIQQLLSDQESFLVVPAGSAEMGYLMYLDSPQKLEILGQKVAVPRPRDGSKVPLYFSQFAHGSMFTYGEVVYE